MAKKIALELDIKSTSVGEATKKTTSFTSELRKLREQMASGELKGEAFEEAAKRAANMKDQMDKVNATVKNLANDNKRLDAFVTTAQGIVGGFAAAQGAAALFGSENEDLQKTMVKLQAAMTLMNGLQQVSNLLRKESALNTVLLGKANVTAAASTNTLSKATKALRVSLIGLGIGAIVVGIGMLIANFDKVKKVVLEFIPGLAKVGEWFTKIKNAVTDFVGVTSDATRAVDALESSTKTNNKQLEREIELMEAQGASARELYLAKRQLLYNDYEALKLKKDTIGLTEEELEAYTNLVQSIAVIDAGERRRLDKERDDARAAEQKKLKEHGDKMAAIAKENAAKRAAAEQVDIERRLQLIQDQETREMALLRNRQALELAAAKERGENIKLLEQLQFDEEMALQEGFDAKRREQAAAEEEAKKQSNAAQVAAEKEKNDLIIQAGIEANAKLLADEKAKDEALLAAKEAFSNQTISILTSLSNLAKDNSKTQKALALGAIAVDTGTAISAAVRNSQANPLNAATGGIAGAVQFATSLAQILSGAAQAKRVLQGGQVRGAGASAGNTRTSTELRPPTQINRDIQLQDRGGTQQRVFVLENDITKSQDRIVRIKANSTID
jgi:hypothetical protein